MNPISLARSHTKIRCRQARIRLSAKDNKPIILIYQMGKVASSSIYDALKNRNDCYGFHTHILAPNSIENKRQRVSNSLWQPDKRLRVAEALYTQLIQPRRPVKIITLVRDPFARNISAFFENSPAVKAARRSSTSTTIDTLIQSFLTTVKHSQPSDWYHNEFEAALGIDVFKMPFNTNARWTEIHQAPYDVLILRTDLSDSEKTQRIAKFLDLPNIEIKRSNQTDSKSINSIYQQFKQQIRFPTKLLNDMLDQPFTTHFFSKEEISEMRSKWA